LLKRRSIATAALGSAAVARGPDDPGLGGLSTLWEGDSAAERALSFMGFEWVSLSYALRAAPASR
jgi:hypothetical protein